MATRTQPLVSRHPAAASYSGALRPCALFLRHFGFLLTAPLTWPRASPSRGAARRPIACARADTPPTMTPRRCPSPPPSPPARQQHRSAAGRHPTHRGALRNPSPPAPGGGWGRFARQGGRSARTSSRPWVGSRRSISSRSSASGSTARRQAGAHRPGDAAIVVRGRSSRQADPSEWNEWSC